MFHSFFKGSGIRCPVSCRVVSCVHAMNGHVLACLHCTDSTTKKALRLFRHTIFPTSVCRTHLRPIWRCVYTTRPPNQRVTLIISLICDNSATTTVSQHCHNNSVTTTLSQVSQQRCHNNSVTTLSQVSQQRCHNKCHNTVTTTVSQQVSQQRCHNCHNNTVTTTLSQQQCHNTVTTTLSQQHCHSNSVTTTVSQQHCHNTVSQQQCHNNVTTTLSQQQCHNTVSQQRHNNTVTTTLSQQQCHNSKTVIFQEKLLKVSKCYNFLRVPRRHNCSPAASFANCVITLHLLKVHVRTFLSMPII